MTKTNQDRVRVLRVIEYEGPRSWVEATLANCAVKGEKRFSEDGVSRVIREAVIGEMPVILQRGAEAEGRSAMRDFIRGEHLEGGRG